MPEASASGEEQRVDLQLEDRVILVLGGHGLVGSAVVARLEAF